MDGQNFIAVETSRDAPRPRHIRVLHTSETARGGVGVYQSILADLPREELEQWFLLPSCHAGIMGPHDRVLTFPSKRRGPRALLAQIKALYRTIADKRPDVVVFHSTLSLLALWAVRLSGRRPKTVFIAHGWAAQQFAEGTLARRLVMAIEGRLCGLADVVVNVSGNDEAFARNHKYAGHHVLIENAVPDLAPCTPARRETSKIELLFVGRLDHQKGLDLALDAFRMARARNPKLRLRVIGESVRGAARFEGSEGVDFLGWVERPDLDAHYASADALLVSSRWEGLPLVIPEALRNGTPVLCARRSSMETLISDGVHGQSFELEVSALTDLLAGLDRQRLASMRPACRALYQDRYSANRLYSEMIDLISGLVPTDATHGASKTR